MKLRDSIGLLGTTLDDLSVEEMVKRVLTLIDSHTKGSAPKLVSFLSTDLLVQSHGWHAKTIRNPELLSALRKAAVSATNSRPLQFLSWLLGKRVKERISQADFLLAFTDSLSLRGKAVFLLGGEGTVAKQAALKLHDRSPGIKVVGVAHPLLHFSGETLQFAQEQDALLIEQINQAAPDVLFLNLGHTKEALWFSRVASQLRIPVVVGLGDSLRIFTEPGTISPKWMDDWGVSPLYQLIQNPFSLWKRYVYHGFKMLYLSTPLILFHTTNRLVFHWIYRLFTKSASVRPPLLFLSPNQTLTLIPFPNRLDKSGIENIANGVSVALNHDVMIFDFSAVRHITLEGASYLMEIWKRAKEQNIELYFLGINADMRFLLRLHRVWDLVSQTSCETPEKLVGRLRSRRQGLKLFEAIHQKKNHVILTFLGTLDNRVDYKSYLQKFIPIIQGKQGIIDLSYCTSIESGGMSFLLQLLQQQRQHKKGLKICGISSQISKQLKRMQTEELFSIYPNLEKALEGQ